MAAIKKYEYHRIAGLAEQLKAANVDPVVVDRIMEGGETVLSKTKPVVKADWLRKAMVRMEDLLELETRRWYHGC